MSKIVFKDVESIRELYEHAKRCKHFRKDFDGKEVQALAFVHDDGLYLMSTGIPHLERPDKPEASKVVYAEGCDPNRNEDFWDRSRELVGGDDFAEYIPIETFDEIFRTNVVVLHIDWSDESYTLGWSVGKKRPPKLEVEPEQLDKFADEDLSPI